MSTNCFHFAQLDFLSTTLASFTIIVKSDEYQRYLLNPLQLSFLFVWLLEALFLPKKHPVEGF
jgi:hypothetical protein